MTARVRKLIGSIAILIFLCAYVWAVSSMSIFVPDNTAAEILYYAITGLCWGLPIFPLISWMHRGR